MIRLVLLSIFLASVSSCAMPGAHKENPEAAKLNIKLGLSYLQQQRLQLAQTKLERALEQDPGSSRGHWAYALLMDKLGSSDSANRHYRKAIELNPRDSEALNNYGAFLCRQDKLTEALEAFDAAIRNPLYRTPVYAYLNAGICAAQHDADIKAELYFRKALELNSKHVSVLYQMALLTHGQKRYLSSRAYRQRLSETLQHEDPKVFWLCVKTENAMNNYAEARRCEQALKAKFPTSQEAATLN